MSEERLERAEARPQGAGGAEADPLGVGYPGARPTLFGAHPHPDAPPRQSETSEWSESGQNCPHLRQPRHQQPWCLAPPTEGLPILGRIPSSRCERTDRLWARSPPAGAEHRPALPLRGPRPESNPQDAFPGRLLARRADQAEPESVLSGPVRPGVPGSAWAPHQSSALPADSPPSEPEQLEQGSRAAPVRACRSPGLETRWVESPPRLACRACRHRCGGPARAWACRHRCAGRARAWGRACRHRCAGPARAWGRACQHRYAGRTCRLQSAEIASACQNHQLADFRRATPPGERAFQPEERETRRPGGRSSDSGLNHGPDPWTPQPFEEHPPGRVWPPRTPRARRVARC